MMALAHKVIGTPIFDNTVIVAAAPPILNGRTQGIEPPRFNGRAGLSNPPVLNGRATDLEPPVLNG
jgi:hypothetical protein